MQKASKGNLIWRERDKQWACTKIIEKGKQQNQPKEKTSFLITVLHITVHIYCYSDFCNHFELDNQKLNSAFTGSEFIFFYKFIYVRCGYRQL